MELVWLRESDHYINMKKPQIRYGGETADFKAIKSGRVTFTNSTKPAPANVGIAGNTWCIRTSTGAYTVADWYLRDVPLLTVDTKLWARWANETHSFHL